MRRKHWVPCVPPARLLAFCCQTHRRRSNPNLGAVARMMGVDTEQGLGSVGARQCAQGTGPLSSIPRQCAARIHRVFGGCACSQVGMLPALFWLPSRPENEIFLDTQLIERGDREARHFPMG